MIEEPFGRLCCAPQVGRHLSIVVVGEEALSQVLRLGDPRSSMSRRADEPCVLRLSDELAVDAEGRLAEASAGQLLVNPSSLADRVVSEYSAERRTRYKAGMWHGTIGL